MSFGSEMRDLASELTEEFAGELGLSKLYHRESESYNDTTGVNTPTWTEHEVYAPMEKIKLGTFSSTGFGSPEYAKDHRQVTVAGDALSVVPKQGDVFNPAGTTDGHEIVFVDMDMYAAAYILHVQIKPTALPVIPEV